MLLTSNGTPLRPCLSICARQSKQSSGTPFEKHQAGEQSSIPWVEPMTRWRSVQRCPWVCKGMIVRLHVSSKAVVSSLYKRQQSSQTRRIEPCARMMMGLTSRLLQDHPDRLPCLPTAALIDPSLLLADCAYRWYGGCGKRQASTRMGERGKVANNLRTAAWFRQYTQGTLRDR